MDHIGKIERETQNRAIELFQKELGYRCLGNWEERTNNSNIEEGILGENPANKNPIALKINAIGFIIEVGGGFEPPYAVLQTAA